MQVKSLVRPEILLFLAFLAAFTAFANIVYIIFSPICFVVALILYFRRPAKYVSFTYWVWMLTPFIRRVVDYSTTYHPGSIVMTAPVLVTAVSALTLFSTSPFRGLKQTAPFLLFIAVVLTGFFVGAVQGGVVAASFDFLNWTIPAFFAIFLLRTKLSAGQISNAVFGALAWGALLLGAYGIFQYYFLPRWDASWMVASEMRSIGRAVAGQVRVFGTLNSPGTYASYMVAGTLVAFGLPGMAKWFAITPAFAGLMLSLVRAAWGELLVGFLVVFSWASTKFKLRYLSVAAAATVILAPIVMYSPIGETFLNRLESISRLDRDVSLLARQRLYAEYSSKLMSNVTGAGLAHSGVAGRLGDLDDAQVASTDSGLLDIFYSFGMLAFLILVALAFIIWGSRPNSKRPNSVVAWSVAVSSLSGVVFGNMFLGAQGMLLLPFFSIALRIKNDIAEQITTESNGDIF